MGGLFSLHELGVHMTKAVSCACMQQETYIHFFLSIQVCCFRDGDISHQVHKLNKTNT